MSIQKSFDKSEHSRTAGSIKTSNFTRTEVGLYNILYDAKKEKKEDRFGH